MAKVRFWRWQHTDEFGMPCPTRFRIADAERKGDEPLEQHPGSLETWKIKRSPNDVAQGTSPK